ncbi:PLP-dependent transferase [Candidatus Palauibacter soopunensis]|uniref:trans-sulfuration enzyme family protein n=1 Tax=Candidatus Palauibacter soopunensis TaxID=3056739 RepID=UPI0023887827|nr:PLP-dependent transferase [Candidatus Palauibacter soopunensis]MDE2877639.1 PLP-dependent transferase [Candidatus Palauibacter soopunensis]
MRIETLAVKTGMDPDATSRAIAPPITLSTTFERGEDGSYPGGFDYSRSGNPNRALLEAALAALEGGPEAVAFPSGMAATFAVIFSLAPGDHVVAADDAYYGTGVLLRDSFAERGIEASFVDMTDLDAVRAAMRPNTRLVWMETPSNPLIRISDIEALAGIAREGGAISCCDNTWATPLLQRPLDFGVDLVMHSTTKYFGGHSDVTGGAVIVREPGGTLDALRKIQKDGGLVPSPFDAWLTRRGLESLAARMALHCANAMELARFLDAHPRVERVHYPGLENDAGHALAARQMSGFGGMLSFDVAGGQEEAFAVAAHVKVIARATSLGGTHSLIEHRASVEGPTTRAPENLLRMSVGLEHIDDLKEDLDRALSAAS